MLVNVLNSCASPCDNYTDKHNFQIGEVVKSKLDSNMKFIITDTTRSECQAEYYVENSEGEGKYILESSLTH